MKDADMIALAKAAGADFQCETLIVNGKDADDFIETLVRLVEQRVFEKTRDAAAKICAKKNPHPDQKPIALSCGDPSQDFATDKRLCFASDSKESDKHEGVCGIEMMSLKIHQAHSEAPQWSDDSEYTEQRIALELESAVKNMEMPE